MTKKNLISNISDSTIVKGVGVLAIGATLIGLGYILPRVETQIIVGDNSGRISELQDDEGLDDGTESAETVRSSTTSALPTEDSNQSTTSASEPKSPSTSQAKSTTISTLPADEPLTRERIVSYNEYSPDYLEDRSSSMAGEFEDVLDYLIPSSTDPPIALELGGRPYDDYLVFTYVGGVYTAFLGPARYKSSWQIMDLNLGKSFSRFTAQVALDDRSSTGLIPLLTISDENEEVLYESEVVFGTSVDLDLDVVDVLRLQVKVYYPPPTEQEEIRLVFAEPTLRR